MVDATIERLERGIAALLDEAVRICEIPAPTFREQTRARAVHARLEAIGGWDHLSIDGDGNVVAIRRGREDRGRTLVGAHLDTVFPDEVTPVTRSRGRMTGHGIGDNSIGVAAMLAVAAAVQAAPPRGVGDLLFVANVGEEGRGDLNGIRSVCRAHADDYDRVIAVEGLSRDRVQTTFVGSLRYEVGVTTSGGHSWGAYGRPNAIALLARALVALETIAPATGITPKTTMNVGVIRGGRSVNTIAPDAVCELDIRSEAATSLAALDRAAKRAMRAAVRAVAGDEDATITMRRIGNRPAGTIDAADPLIRAILVARRESGLGAPEFYAGSTDANWPTSLGRAATSIGVTNGGEPHTDAEWIATGPVKQGLPYLGRAVCNTARLPRPR